MDATRTISQITEEGDRPWIVVSTERGLFSSALPAKPELVFGRSPDADVTIEDDSVSRQHAAIRGDKIRDLGSRNGTRVGGVLLRKGEEAPLVEGHVVELGSVSIVVHRNRPKRRARAQQAGERVVLDPTMKRLYELGAVIGPSELHVIVLGETGTGKEVYAEGLHAVSARRGEPFRRVNCATLSGTLLDSELFGYDKGAFTGAAIAKPGLLETAHRGTVFLDEIGELPLDTQAKLLRAVETGEVTRLGAIAPRRVDVRYIAATHVDLAQAVRDKRFRADLYYRLDGFTITLPPLRRRTVEIVPLAEMLLARAKQSAKLDASAKRALEAHDWPGNVRELRTVIERAIVLARGAATITSDHVMITRDPATPPTGRAHAIDVLSDRARVEEALRDAGGSQTRAAKALGVSRRALINRIDAWGLDRPRKP